MLLREMTVGSSPDCLAAKPELADTKVEHKPNEQREEVEEERVRVRAWMRRSLDSLTGSTMGE